MCSEAFAALCDCSGLHREAADRAGGAMTAPGLFDVAPRFDGPSYDPAIDEARLAKQIGRVFDLMLDGRWGTLQEIADATGDPHASISAQLRHLRKARFGGYVVEKRRRAALAGSWEYRLGTGGFVR